ncbi:Protoheme IX farnesyltransferase [Senna tora]|uniref:Protoheme IX farnesyltransferase n=1 Tax=Senna tora TaxID=362788 RepID=A0A834T5H7_9FABA|nr:Protoheme IX farnesyltransferase [Senna tora]
MGEFSRSKEERGINPRRGVGAGISAAILVKEKEDSESEQYDEYDIDTEKAREALQKLDQQLQSLSTKKISSPKLRASDVKLMRGEESVNIREKEVEISPSFLAYTAAGAFGRRPPKAPDNDRAFAIKWRRLWYKNKFL